MKTPIQSGSPLSGGVPGSPRRGGGGGDKGKLCVLLVFAACLFSLRSSFSLWNNNGSKKLHKKTEEQKRHRPVRVVTDPKKPDVHETLSFTGDAEPDIALVAIVSMQDSSSMFLTEAAMTNNGTNPCVLSLNDVFSKSIEWEKHGQDVHSIQPPLVREFILRVATKKCVDQLTRMDDRNNVCHNRCIAAFHEFNNQLSLEQHKWLWRYTPNLTTIVLERNVEDRWKSKWVAIQTGDWDTHGSLEHKKQAAAMDIPPMNVSETEEYCKSHERIIKSACNFGQTHKEWYEFVRANIHYKRRVEISFDAAILNGGRYARELIASALPLDFQDLLIPPAEQIMDPQLAFVAVVSMQRSSSSTLTNIILSNNKTNPCVLSLNEIFINSPRQSGDAWPIDGRHLQHSPKGLLNPVLLRDFLVRVAKRRCQQQLLTSNNKCENRCIVTFKQFPEHLKQEHHEFMWSNIPNLTLAVLERNVQDRWKSRYVAETTGNWNTRGTKWHKKLVSRTLVPPINVSDSTEFCKKVKWNQLCHFDQKHQEWYKLVRGQRALANKRVEVSFANVVEQEGKMAKFMITQALPLAFQPIVRLE